MRKSFLDNYQREASLFDIMSEFESFFGDRSPQRTLQKEMRSWRPAVDVEENEWAYLLSFDLPGVKPEDVKIDLNERRLTISGSRTKTSNNDSSDGRLHQYERVHGEFERSFALPDSVALDKIEAHFSDGVLELVAPKNEQTQPRNISISTGRSSFFDKLVGSKKSSEKIEAKKH